MYFPGGKSKQAKSFVSALLTMNEEGLPFHVPFMGGGSIVEELVRRTPLPVTASDLFEDLVEMWVKVIEGWDPPSAVSRERWRECRSWLNCTRWERTYVGFAASYLARFYRSYVMEGYAKLVADCRIRTLEKAKAMRDHGVAPFTEDFLEYLPGPRHFVYCDPPYAGAAHSFDHLAPFDHAAFWDKVREVTLYGTPIVVSEYEAPGDFVPVYTRMQQVSKRKEGSPRASSESLWVLRGSPLSKWEGVLQVEGDPLPHSPVVSGRVCCSLELRKRLERAVSARRGTVERECTMKSYIEGAILQASRLPFELVHRGVLMAQEDGDRAAQVRVMFDSTVYSRAITLSEEHGCTRMAAITAALLLRLDDEVVEPEITASSPVYSQPVVSSACEDLVV